jgi:L-ascorbate metabolism protein UlaG (beta-lactamase superfamily)
MRPLKKALGMTAPPPHWYARQHQHGQATGERLALTYLGTAGFVLSGSGRTVVLDPYVSRPPLQDLLVRRLTSDEALVRRLLPHANDVLIGHSHYDHILDAPTLCKQTGARLIGSRSTVMVGRAAGLPEHQLLETSGGENIACGPWTVRGFPSLHGKVAFGRIPFPGDMNTPPNWPPRLHELKHGLVLNWLVDTGRFRVMHIDSADYLADELCGHHADVLCLCAVGRKYRPNYVREVLRLVKPRWVVPCHWDTMLTPIDATPSLIPGVNLEGFMEEIRNENVEPLLMPLLGRLTFSA